MISFQRENLRYKHQHKKMSYLRYSFAFLIIVPALIQSCEFTSLINSKDTGSKFDIKVVSGGSRKNANEATYIFEEESKMNKSNLNPGHVFNLYLNYPDGKGRIFNMSTTEEAFHVAYTYIKTWNRKVIKTECRDKKFQYHGKLTTTLLTYFDSGAQPSNASYTLKFSITKITNDAMSNNKAPFSTAFITAFIVIFMNLSKV